MAALRIYYKNVKGLDNNSTEFYVNKKYSSCYFWIFPVADGVANVGLGMLSSNISANNFKLRKMLDEWISESTVLQERLAGAERVDKVRGFGLPLGTRRVQMVGDHFMLIGDAASLIDPMSGHGIDSAMLSGQLAGEQIIKSFTKNNFSKEFLETYPDEVFKVLGKSFKQKTKLLRLSNKYPNVSYRLIRLASFFMSFRN